MKNSLLAFFVIICLYSCSKIEARRPVSVRTHVSLASTSKELKKLNELEDARIAQFIKSDSLRTYINSQNGFWYSILEKSNKTVTPKYGDKVTYYLEIRNLNNQIIYSETELGIQDYWVDKEELITGLQLGIKLMSEGDKVQFLIPPYSAYGIVGDQKKIGNNQSILALVTLKTINK